MPATIGAIITGATFAATGSTFAAGVAFAASGFEAAALAGVSVGSIVGTVALTGLSVALQPSAPSLASSKIASRNPVGPRSRSYGRVRKSGQLAELKVSEIVSGHEGDGVLFNATMINSGEIDAFEKHFIHDQEVRIDGAGAATYPGVFNDNARVFLYTHLGTASQSVDNNLAAAFPARWTNKHRLDGIAYVVGQFNGVPLEDFATVYAFGIPNYSATIRAAKVWDPRDEDQDADDPDTWTWTQNAALIIMDFIWHDDGMRLSRSLLDIDAWIEAADYCDDEITLIGGGTEARYRLSGSYELTDPPKDVLKRMLAPIDGRLRLSEDASIVLDVGQFEAPTEHETFGADDIIAYTLRRGAPKTELRNEIRATYTSPGHNLQPQEADPWLDRASVESDGRQSAVLDLTWCPSHRQARQRMKVEAARQNPEWVGTVVLNARGLNLLSKRHLHLTITDLGIATTFFLTKPANINLLAGTVTCEVVSFPSTAYDWTAAEEGVSPENETPGDWGVVVPEGATGVTITADGAGGGGCENDGGDGGARSILTIAVDPSDWGTILQFTVGADGIGDPLSVSATDGGDSTVTGTLTAGAIDMFAGGGNCNLNGNGPGTATGGDTNTSGSSSDGGNGGEAASGATENEAPGGGGHEGVDGGNGRVTFDWVF